MRAWTLITALPPTKGHLHLIQFTSRLASAFKADVVIATRPHEPYPYERYESLADTTEDYANVHWYSQDIEQNPEAPGFWEKWKEIFYGFGFKPGDYVVTSEAYGRKLAEVLEGHWMTYDPDRSIFPCKASYVRHAPLSSFDKMIPEFQKHIRQTVTLFGAESTGKTTLSKYLASNKNGHWIPEWARPYLETVENVVNTRTMTDIWHGQAALQWQTWEFAENKPFIFQDTDLYSTVGYWDIMDGQTPQGLLDEAKALASDLYLITKSNIPFEPDPLRYGGDRRESDDQFWIDLCEKHGLKYYVIQAKTPELRLAEASRVVEKHFFNNVKLGFVREHND